MMTVVVPVIGKLYHRVIIIYRRYRLSSAASGIVCLLERIGIAINVVPNNRRRNTDLSTLR